MAQITTGIRKIFEIPAIYTLFQNSIGAKRFRKRIVDLYLDIKPDMEVLDVGCGPGDIMEFLPDNIKYTGFDFEQSYILNAQKRFTNRNCTFICEDINTFNFSDKKFDRVIITGVLHHLNDMEVNKLLIKIKSVLKLQGKLICVENAYTEDQSALARFLISKDRGLNIRTPQEYKNICDNIFNKVSYKISHCELRIPYTHIFLTCSL